MVFNSDQNLRDVGNDTRTAAAKFKVASLVLILTATYDGKPPDSAVPFFEWLQTQV